MDYVGGKKYFNKYLRGRVYSNYENYFSSEVLDDDYDTDGMNQYYENNHDLLDVDLYSGDPCFEDGSGITDYFDYSNFTYEENFHDDTNHHFEEYSYPADDSSYYENDDCLHDLDSYYEQNHVPDDFFCVDAFDITIDEMDPYYEKQSLDEDSEIVCRSNTGIVCERAVTKNEYSLLSLRYVKLLEDLMLKFFVSSSDVTRSIKHLIACYRLVNRGQLPLEIDFNSMQYCLGYLHRYGACHMALVLEAVSTMLESSRVLYSMLNKRKLNVVFLGGGPCNDVLGFLAALHGHHNLWALDISVVDKMAGWENVFMEIVNRLQQGDFDQAGRVFKEITVAPSFITGDIAKFFSLSAYMQEKLAMSDVIFLVKTLSHIPDTEKLDVLENILIYLKPGALLVYMDFPFPRKIFESFKQRLRLVYRARKTNYSFYLKSFKFGYASNSKCRAEVRVFERM